MPDLINPLETFIVSILHPLERITWRRRPGLTPYQVETALRQRGVRVYGRIMTDHDTAGLHVRRAQAPWARYILAAILAGRPLPPAWDPQRSARPTTPIAAIVDIICRFL